MNKKVFVTASGVKIIIDEKSDARNIRKEHTEYDGNDTCATCWHCHTTTLHTVSTTGLLCAVTHKPVHPMDDPCESFRLCKYFAEQKAQHGREDA